MDTGDIYGVMAVAYYLILFIGVTHDDESERKEKAEGRISDRGP
jgi:hypothetical protein